MDFCLVVDIARICINAMYFLNNKINYLALFEITWFLCGHMRIWPNVFLRKGMHMCQSQQGELFPLVILLHILPDPFTNFVVGVFGV